MTVLSTGIGIGNIDISVTELDALANVDFATRQEKAQKRQLTLVRLGTSGAIQPDIKVGEFVFSRTSVGFDGLLADYARQKGAGILVKGVRNTTDFDLEYQQAAINRGICPELETLLLPASPAYQHFSSTMVREMIRYGQPLEKYVPAPVAEELKGR